VKRGRRRGADTALGVVVVVVVYGSAFIALLVLLNRTFGWP
jgi:threonine/homoserine/homoserine lactone efflux protein